MSQWIIYDHIFGVVGSMHFLNIFVMHYLSVSWFIWSKTNRYFVNCLSVHWGLLFVFQSKTSGSVTLKLVPSQRTTRSRKCEVRGVVGGTELMLQRRTVPHIGYVADKIYI